MASIASAKSGGTRVVALQKRSNELASPEDKPLLSQEEFGAMQKRLHSPPALPGEEFQFDNDNFRTQAIRPGTGVYLLNLKLTTS